MALEKYTLTYGYWKKISLKGQSGSPQIVTTHKGLDPVIAIAHTKETQDPTDDIPLASAVDLSIDTSFCIRGIGCNVDVILDPDGPLDIYYATPVTPGSTIDLVVDFI